MPFKASVAKLVDAAVFKTEALRSVRVRVPSDALSFYQLPPLLGVVFLPFGGGVASIRRSVSSRPIPSPLCSSFGEFGGGLGFDGFPDFVAGKLSLVGQPLPFDALEQCLRALHVIHAEGNPMVPAEIELSRVALKVRFADAVERADQAALE